jgi:hypothetical protein
MAQLVPSVRVSALDSPGQPGTALEVPFAWCMADGDEA